MKQEQPSWSRSGSVSPSQLSTASSGSPLVRDSSPNGSRTGFRPRNNNNNNTDNNNNNNVIPSPKRMDPVAIAAAQLQNQKARRLAGTQTATGSAKERAHLEKERELGVTSEGSTGGFGKSGGLTLGAFGLGSDYWTVSNRLRYLNLVCLLATLGCLLAVFLLASNKPTGEPNAGASQLPVALASRRSEIGLVGSPSRSADEFELAAGQTVPPKKASHAPNTPEEVTNPTSGDLKPKSEREIEDSFDEPAQSEPMELSTGSGPKSNQLDRLLSRIFGGSTFRSGGPDQDFGPFRSPLFGGQTIIVRSSIGPSLAIGGADEPSSWPTKSASGPNSLLERLMMSGSSPTSGRSHLSIGGPFPVSPRAWWSMTSPLSMSLSSPGSPIMMSGGSDDSMQPPSGLSRSWPAASMFEPSPPLFAAPFPAGLATHNQHLGPPHPLPAPPGLLGMIVRAASQLDELASSASMPTSGGEIQPPMNSSSNANATNPSETAHKSSRSPFVNLYQSAGRRHQHAHSPANTIMVMSSSLPSPFQSPFVSAGSPFQSPSFMVMGGGASRLPSDPILRAIMSNLATGSNSPLQQDQQQSQEAARINGSKLDDQSATPLTDDMEEPIEWQPASSEQNSSRDEPPTGSAGSNDTKAPNQLQSTGSWSESSSELIQQQQSGEPDHPSGLLTGTIRQTFRGPGVNLERVIQLPAQVSAGLRSQSIRREFEEAAAMAEEPTPMFAPAAESRADMVESLPVPLGNLFGRLLADLTRRQPRNRSLMDPSLPDAPSSSSSSSSELESLPSVESAMMESDTPVSGSTEAPTRPQLAVFGVPLLGSPKIRLLSARIRIRPIETTQSGSGGAESEQITSRVGAPSFEDTFNSMEDRLSQMMAGLGKPETNESTLTGQQTLSEVHRPVPVSHIAMGRANQPQLTPPSSVMGRPPTGTPAPVASSPSSNSLGQPLVGGSSKGENPFTSPSSPLFGFPSMASLSHAQQHDNDNNNGHNTRPERPSSAGSNRQQRAFTYHSNFELADPAKRQRQQQEQQQQHHHHHHRLALLDQTQERQSIKARFLEPGAAGSASDEQESSQADVMGRRLDDGPFSARSLAESRR